VVGFARAYLDLVTSSDPLARVHVVLWAQAVAGAADIHDSRAEWDRHFRNGVADVIARATHLDTADAWCDTTSVLIVGMLRGVAMQHLLDNDAV
jgi:hypothetical protein